MNSKRITLSDEQYKKLISDARSTNAYRSRSERENGLMPADEVESFKFLRIVESALQAGMRTGDWNAIAEGYAMLVDYFHIPVPEISR